MPSATETVFRGPTHDRIHDDMLERLRVLRHDEGGLRERLSEIDREWDLDRMFFLGAGIVVSASAVYELVKRGRGSPALVAGPFLLARALLGWAPPLAILRRFAVRTRQEIEHERVALRATRGDFGRALAPDEAFHAAESA
jgi:hypothetical protein